jgi:hemoglobin-like flavoprotein
LAALLQAVAKVLKQENKLLKAWDDLKTTIARLMSKKRANKKPRKKH